MASTPRAKFRKGFKTFAEEKSISLRKELGIKPSYPLQAVNLARHLNVGVLYPDDIPGIDPATLDSLHKQSNSSWSGVTISNGKKFTVIINKSHSSARQESNIMHELAHIICEHKMEQLSNQHEGLSLRDYNEEQEKEAEWLGACLQLPRVALHFHYKVYGNTHEEIANKFNASLEMVRYRINVCGIRR